MFLPRFLVLALFATSALAIPVAPLPPQIAPMWTSDVDGDAETNGQSTLVVWTAEFSLYRESHSIAIRLLDSANDGLGVTVASGHTPYVATNGSEYLIAHSRSASRFWFDDYYNVGIVLINPDGTRAAAKNINYSRSGSAGGAAWNGSHWIVSFTSGNVARAAIIESDLTTMQFVDLGAGAAGEVQMIGDTAWVAVENGTARELVELNSDGAVGRRHVLTGGSIRIVPTGDEALVFTQENDGVHVARFDPSTGAAVSNLVAPALQLRDLEPHVSGAILLLQSEYGAPAFGMLVDSNGTPGEPILLGASFPYSVRLGRALDGLVLVDSRNRGALDVYLTRINIPEPLDFQNSLLVSVGNVAQQTNGVVVAAGDNALAVWSQTIAPGKMATFRRWFDAQGHPLDEPLQLPLSLDAAPVLLLDGDRFLISWVDAAKIHLARLSADATTLSEPFVLGQGIAPALAQSGETNFLTWQGGDDYQVWGTPLRSDGSPVVPDGFPILRNFMGSQSAPRIAAHPRGFHLLWSDPGGVTSVVVSPEGTPLSSTQLADTPAEPRLNSLLLASSTNSALAAWVGSYDGGPTLYAFSADAPFELFDPHWGERWIPLEILPIGPDVYLCVIARDGFVFTSEVTMSSGFITGISPLVPLASVDNLDVSVARPGPRTLILHPVGRELHLDTNVPTKRRAAGR